MDEDSTTLLMFKSHYCPKLVLEVTEKIKDRAKIIKIILLKSYTMSLLDFWARILNLNSSLIGQTIF